MQDNGHITSFSAHKHRIIIWSSCIISRYFDVWESVPSWWNSELANHLINAGSVTRKNISVMAHVVRQPCKKGAVVLVL